MRIAKNINYNIAKNLDMFLLLKKKINKIKETKPESPISQVENVSKLNYYLVIDCKDMSEEFDFKNQKNSGYMLFGTEEKNKKFIDYIKKKNTQPFYFKKLGLLSDILGCFLIATTKNSEENITVYNSINTVSCKLDIDNLPIDFEFMCNEYEEYSIDNNIRTNPYLSDIFKISNEDRDKLIESIVSSLAFVELPKQSLSPIFDIPLEYEHNISGINIEDIIENKLNNIYDISFLEQVMEGAIRKDNFELCAKIRDRINKIKKT